MAPANGDLQLLKADYREAYKLGKTLGQGAFGKVKLATRRSDGIEVAVKLVNTNEWSERERKQFENEIRTLYELQHPNIVRLFDVYESEPRQYAMIMELASGGELFDRIQQRGSFSEQEAQFVMRKLLSALAYMHKKDIAHRDLKPENIMYATGEENSEPKLTDFGFAKKAQPIEEDVPAGATSPPPGALKTRLGSPNYVAPEILTSKTGYSTSVDIWSMGVILYILLCGYFPFYHENERELYRQIKAGKFDMPVEEWGHVSDNAKDLVRKMLQINPKKRITAHQALRHPWLRGEASSEIMPEETLKAFSDMNRIRKRSFKGAAQAIAAAVRTEKARGGEGKAEVGDVAVLAIQKARRAAAAAEEDKEYTNASMAFADEITSDEVRRPEPKGGAGRAAAGGAGARKPMHPAQAGNSGGGSPMCTSCALM